MGTGQAGTSAHSWWLGETHGQAHAREVAGTAAQAGPRQEPWLKAAPLTLRFGLTVSGSLSPGLPQGRGCWALSWPLAPAAKHPGVPGDALTTLAAELTITLS